MRRVQSRKLSDDIMEQLESMILDGRLLAGQKLSSERTLAEQFAVSRPSVREAIQKLEAKNLVERKQGGGTFIKPRLNELITDPLLLLLSEKPEMQFDLLEFRHALEGMAAYYAALRGQSDDFRALENALDALPSGSNSDYGQRSPQYGFTACNAQPTVYAARQYPAQLRSISKTYRCRAKH
jgi:GntR family transcriptional repressor for pyruvate dehydrogenase complex